MEDSEEKRNALFNKNPVAYRLKYSCRYLGPGNILMKFKNFNPMRDPRIEASQYEDSFPDVGREEMEKRFSQRRDLFLRTYDREQPRQSLAQYIKAAQKYEEYRYKPVASTGPVSLFLGGSIPRRQLEKGELPECQLLGFVDGERRAGCMAHPLAETSQGYDGRDQVGFFNHTGCCRSIGCDASKEFGFLSASAMKIFDKAVDGMSWYEYSRHATSVLVYYLRSYDHVLRMLDERELLDSFTLEHLVRFTNALFDEWPLRKPEHPLNAIRAHGPDHVDSLDMLSTDILLSERIMYIALDTWFARDHFPLQLQQARTHVALWVTSRARRAGLSRRLSAVRWKPMRKGSYSGRRRNPTAAK